jgi:hypothetical protein
VKGVRVLIQNWVLGIFGTAVGASVVWKFGGAMDSALTRVFLLLSGPFSVYTLALLYVLVCKRGLLEQRAKAYWLECLNAVLEDRSSDPSFTDAADLAAWFHAMFCRFTYAIGGWEVDSGE